MEGYHVLASYETNRVLAAVGNIHRLEHLCDKGALRAEANQRSVFLSSHCTNDFGAVHHNERRFQFRLGQSYDPKCSGFVGKSRLNHWIGVRS